MDEMLRKAIADYFEPGDFADYLGVTVDDMMNAFPDELEDALDEIKELMEWEDVGENDD